MATRRTTRDDDVDDDDDVEDDDDDDEVEVVMFRGRGAARRIDEWLGISRHPTASDNGGTRRRPASSSARSSDRSPRRKEGYFGS